MQSMSAGMGTGSKNCRQNSIGPGSPNRGPITLAILFSTVVRLTQRGVPHYVS